MTDRSTLGKPYHSTTGIPQNIVLWIAAAFLLFAAVVAFRVWRNLRKEGWGRNTKYRKTTKHENHKQYQKTLKNKVNKVPDN